MSLFLNRWRLRCYRRYKRRSAMKAGFSTLLTIVIVAANLFTSVDAKEPELAEAVLQT